MAKFGIQETGLSDLETKSSSFVKQPSTAEAEGIAHAVGAIGGTAKAAAEMKIKQNEETARKEARTIFEEATLSQISVPTAAEADVKVSTEEVATTEGESTNPSLENFKKTVARAHQVGAQSPNLGLRAQSTVKSEMMRLINQDPAFEAEYRQAAREVIGDYSAQLRLLEPKPGQLSEEERVDKALRSELTTAIGRYGANPLKQPVALMSREELVNGLEQVRNLNLSKVQNKGVEESSGEEAFNGLAELDTTNSKIAGSVIASTMDNLDIMIKNGATEQDIAALGNNFLKEYNQMVDELYAGSLRSSNKEVAERAKGMMARQKAKAVELKDYILGDFSRVPAATREVTRLAEILQLQVQDAVPIITALKQAGLGEGLNAMLQGHYLTTAVPQNIVDEFMGMVDSTENGLSQVARKRLKNYVQVSTKYEEFSQLDTDDKIVSVKGALDNLSAIKGRKLSKEESSGSLNQLGYTALALEENPDIDEKVDLVTEIFEPESTVDFLKQGEKLNPVRTKSATQTMNRSFLKTIEGLSSHIPAGVYLHYDPTENKYLFLPTGITPEQYATEEGQRAIRRARAGYAVGGIPMPGDHLLMRGREEALNNITEILAYTLKDDPYAAEVGIETILQEASEKGGVNRVLGNMLAAKQQKVEATDEAVLDVKKEAAIDIEETTEWIDAYKNWIISGKTGPQPEPPAHVVSEMSGGREGLARKAATGQEGWTEGATAIDKETDRPIVFKNGEWVFSQITGIYQQ
jgi:hypothetical protein